MIHVGAADSFAFYVSYSLAFCVCPALSCMLQPFRAGHLCVMHVIWLGNYCVDQQFVRNIHVLIPRFARHSHVYIVHKSLDHPIIALPNVLHHTVLRAIYRQFVFPSPGYPLTVSFILSTHFALKSVFSRHFSVK